MKITSSMYRRNNIINTVTYPGLAWLIIMGSGLDDWIYSLFFTIAIKYNSSKSITFHNSLHSLLDHERLFFHCDDLRTTNHCWHFELLERRLSDESFETEISWNELTSRRTITNGSIILLLFILSVAMKRSSLLPSNGGSAADCVTARCIYWCVA
jgi:hypothetical protein